jgi:hypothetical protein
MSNYNLPPLPEWFANSSDLLKADLRNLQIAAVEADRAARGDPARWEYRWLNPSNIPDSFDTDWKVVEPRRNETIADRIAELETYTYVGKPVYECRPLYTSPSYQ